MSEEIERERDRLRDDFAARFRKPFKHFFCPILGNDEDAELCMGHIVNKAIPGSARTRILQRKDIDNFFGSIAEAEFEALVAVKGKPLEEVLFNKELSRKARPKVTVDGEECKHHLFDGRTAQEHTRLHLRGKDGSMLDLVLHKSPAEVAAAEMGEWRFIVNRDCRIPALVSLIKAAHLTLFHMLGYTYIDSAAGRYVGYDILGKFYLQNRGKSVEKQREAANLYFPEFARMARPVDSVGDTSIRGTVEDNKVLVCHGSSGRAFAIGVFIRTNEVFHCVLIPAFDQVDAVPTYLGFMANSSESLATRISWYNRGKGIWESNQVQPIHTMWPKDNDSFCFT